VFSEVLRAHRAIEVDDFDQLAEVLAVCQGSRWPQGPRIGVTAGSGGVTELILDVTATTDVQLPALSSEDRAEAERVIGQVTGDGNPLDYWGNGDFYKNLPHALATLGASKTYDAVVYCLDSHDGQPMVMPDRLMAYVQMLAEGAAKSDKPHYMLNMRPGLMYTPQVTYLREQGIPVIGGSRQGLRAIGLLANARARLPPVRPASNRPATLASGRRTMNEYEAKRVLAAHELPVIKERLVFNLDEAQTAAAEIGYPVVLKVTSDDIPHKSDYGLVVLGIGGAAEMTAAWETLCERLKGAGFAVDGTGFVVQEFIEVGIEVFAGISRDTDFGLSLAFGMGGVGIEIFKDFSLRMLPLREGDAEAMIAETKVASLLRAHRGQPAADEAALVDCLYRLSDFAMAEASHLAEIDLNPIKVLPAGMGCRIVDALIVTQ
jgi:acyl-CoA synthetase (NDP forming)